jgi:hypothetical protein
MVRSFTNLSPLNPLPLRREGGWLGREAKPLLDTPEKIMGGFSGGNKLLLKPLPSPFRKGRGIKRDKG